MTRSMATIRFMLALLWGLVIMWIVTGKLDASAQAQLRPEGSHPLPRTVKGFGQTQSAAQRHALEEALRALEDYLHRLEPPVVHWKPTVGYLRQEILIDTGEPGENVDLGKNGQGKSWVLYLKVPDLDNVGRLEYEAILNQREQQRIESIQPRLLLASRAFVTVFVGLLTLFLAGKLSSLAPARHQHWLHLAALAGTIGIGGLVFWHL